MNFSPQAPWGQEFCGHCSEVAGRWLGGRSSFKSVNEPGWSLLLLILFPWMRCYNIVHHRVIPSIKFSGTHSYAWVTQESHCESKESCPRTQSNGLARAGTCTAQLQVHHTNHEATTPPQWAEGV